MRVLHVVKAYDQAVRGIELGGLETAVRLLTRELSRSMEVEVLTCGEGPARVDILSESLRIIRVPRLFTAFRVPVAPGLRREIAARGPHLIHLHHPYPFGEFSCLLSGVRAPVVLTWHSDVLKPRLGMALYKPFLRALLARAKAIMVGSPQYLGTSKYLADFRRKCQIVPFAIVPSAFSLDSRREALRDRLRAKHGSPLVLFVGRFVYYKGLPYLVQAMSRAEGHLVLVGDGPDRPMVEGLVRVLGLQERVSIYRGVSDDDLPAFYHACDLFVLPSVAITEAFGIVLLEAMVCGKPVISTSLPTGVVFVNRDGETGLVTPPGDPWALAEAVNRLARDPALRERLGRQGQHRVLEEFTLERHASRVRAIYEAALGDPRQPHPEATAPRRRG